MIYIIPIALLVFVGVIVVSNRTNVESVSLGLSGLTITFYNINSGKKRK